MFSNNNQKICLSMERSWDLESESWVENCYFFRYIPVLAVGLKKIESLILSFAPLE